MEKTLGIIKPDAVGKKVVGKIISRIEEEGFIIKGLKILALSVDDAKAFYAVHKDKPFYEELVKFMVSGPVVVLLLEREKAVSHWRKIMGATDPANADEGTIRKMFASSIQNNAVHGSDSKENAEKEINFFFNYIERV
jgi:nucleoside-diphosphate kinase